MSAKSSISDRTAAQTPTDNPLTRLLATIETLHADAELRVKAEQDLQGERGLLQAIIDQVPGQLFVKDTACRFLVANDACAAGRTFIATGEVVIAATMIGKTDFEMFPREIAQGVKDIEARIMQSGQPMIDILEHNLDEAGHSRWLSMSKVPLRNANHEVIGLLGVGHDVTARKLAEDQVHFLAHHDALTGLPNRILLIDRLTQATLHAQRGDRWVTVVFADFDNFKLVNDSLGHEAGDAVLKAIADRMAQSVRATDSVVRLGGDEFVILLVDQPNNADLISTTIEKIRAAVAEPIFIAGQSLQMTCSMGIATFPNDGQDAETLLRNADMAMYQAKALGRDNFEFFTAAMNTKGALRITPSCRRFAGVDRRARLGHERNRRFEAAFSFAQPLIWPRFSAS